MPISRSPTGRASDSPTKSLFDSETSTGQPVATISASRRVTSSECQRVLAEVVSRVDQHDCRGRPRAPRPVRPRRPCRRGRRPSRRRTRSDAAGCAARLRRRGCTPVAASYSRRDRPRAGVAAAPRVVEHVGAGLDTRPPRPRAPGVDADHQRRGTRRAPRRRRRRCARSPRRRSTSVPGAAFTPPMSTISAPSATTSRTRSQRAVELERRALVVERVGRPVDDRHDQQSVVGERRACRASAPLPPRWGRTRPADARPAGRARPPRRGSARSNCHSSGDAVAARRRAGARPPRGSRPPSRRGRARTGAGAPARRDRPGRSRRARRSANDVQQHGQLDAVTRSASTACSKRRAAHGPLAGERLHHGCQRGPVQVEQRAGDQLGDPTALRSAVRGTAVVAARGRRTPSPARPGSVSSGPSRPGDEVRAPLGEVGVDEHEEVAARHEQRLPQRLALAAMLAEVGADVARRVHDGAVRRAAIVAVSSVESESMTTSSSTQRHPLDQVGADAPRRCRRSWPPRRAPG